MLYYFTKNGYHKITENQDSWKLQAELENRNKPEAEHAVLVDLDDPERYSYRNGQVVAKSHDELFEAGLIREEEYIENINRPVITKLQEIDLKTVRSLREYIASLPDAPAWVKDLEKQAVAERANLGKPQSKKKKSAVKK